MLYVLYGIGTPHPLARRRVFPSPFGSGGRDTLSCGRWGGGPNSDEGTDIVVVGLQLSVSNKRVKVYLFCWIIFVLQKITMLLKI